MPKISNAALEEAVLTLLAFSPEQAALVALRIQDNSLFTTPVNQSIAKACLEYIKKYSTPPGLQLEYLLEKELKQGENGRLLNQQLVILQRQAANLQPQFIIENLDRFIEIQKLQQTLESSLEILNSGDLDAARDTLYQQVASSAKNSSIIWLADPKQAFSFLDKEELEDFFTTGIDILDQRGVRPGRKMLFFIIAASGKGKSWWMIEVGKGGIQYHHKVLHVTLEMSAEKVARRYLQSIFALTKSEAASIRTTLFARDAQGALQFNYQELLRESVIAKRAEIAAKLIALNPRIVIAEFPTSVLSVEHLALFMDTLERDHKFHPDLLIVDYADLMKIDAEALRIDTGRLYRELRGLAVARNVALVSGSQGNRESEDASLVRSTNVAEDWSKIGTADGIITYSQTPYEFEQNLARVFVSKYRDSSDKFITLISQAYPIGQFCLDSVPMTVELAQQLRLRRDS